MVSEKEEPSHGKVFELLSRAENGAEVTVRDDQQEFPALLDASRICRRRGGRFRLIDSGRFGLSELEWLAEAGADIYTSDEARTDRLELNLLAMACRRGKSAAVFFQRGAIEENAEGGAPSLSFLLDIGRSGIDLHLTNREVKRDFKQLAELAHACVRSGACFVYYHCGSLSSELLEPARSGGWIHLSSKSLIPEEDAALLAEVARYASAAGAGLVLHIEQGLEIRLLRDLFHSGAFLIFKIPPGERGSLLRRLEDEVGRRRPGFRAYYLYLDFLP